MLVLLRVPSSPAQTPRSFSTRPTHRLLRNRSPGDVRFAQASTAYVAQEANSLRLSSSRVRTPGARERCAYPSSPILVCAFGGAREASTPRRFRLDFVLRFHYKGPRSVA
jgi:hypothetical protein